MIFKQMEETPAYPHIGHFYEGEEPAPYPHIFAPYPHIMWGLP
jgi:hypothetical protein